MTSRLFLFNRMKCSSSGIHTTKYKTKTTTLISTPIPSTQNYYYFSTGPNNNKKNVHTEQHLIHDTNPPATPESLLSTKKVSLSPSYIHTISELSKARLSALVVSTTTFGYLSAAPIPIDYTTLACVSLGTALCSSSASTFNQILEYDRDSKMKRTSKRPLVTQDVIGIKGAVALATTTGLSGGSILYYGTDSITTMLGVGNIALYAGAYTYMKPRSEWNTWCGAIVGAVPPVMGYTAATKGFGLLDLEAALIGSTLLLWQFPHFFALAWMHRVDYARGGFEMVSTNDINGHRTAKLITNYTYYLSTLPLISTLTGITSSMFAVESILFNGYAIYAAKKFEKERSNGNARKVFLTSLWYLPCWMTLFLLHSKKWKEGVEENEKSDNIDAFELELIPYLKKSAASIRQKGKAMCVHEFFAFDDVGATSQSADEKKVQEFKTNVKDKCPIVLGKATAKQAVKTSQNSNIQTSVQSQK